jgi:hypothetical protein
MSATPVRVRVRNARFYVRNVRTRMPFRYGVAQLVGYPILHARLDVETVSGLRAEGVAADALPPKWFDKNPRKDFRDNVNDLLAVTFAARDAYLSTDEYLTPFELSREGWNSVVAFADESGLNHLTAGFGSALFERAVLDAVGRALNVPYAVLIRENLVGVEMSSVHPELGVIEPRDVIPDRPLDRMWIRHTVGLSDPIRSDDIAPAERLDDGLPQSLEEYIARHRLRYFKVKVSGDTNADLLRLEEIAELLDSRIEEPYWLTLDGNEQYKHVEPFAALVDELRRNDRFARFFSSILFIEQPLERGIALNDSLSLDIGALSGVRPVIVDESDSDPDAFEHAIAMGYRGISAKNCKGVYKSLMNQALARLYSERSIEGVAYFLSGEDLINTSVVPLHQDLATLATLGISHAERNAHHYVRGLMHLSESERAGCLAVHGDMYADIEGLAQLNIVDGQIRIGSLQVAGYGVGVPTDYAAMTPFDAWSFDSLGVA